MPSKKRLSKTAKILRSFKKSSKKQSMSLTGDFVLPNNSGEHLRGIKRNAPVNDYDLVNKEYTDTQDQADRDYAESLATRKVVDLFLTNNASDIGTYKDIEADVITAAEETIVQSITGNDTTLIASFASILDEEEIDAMTLLESGIYSLHIHALAATKLVVSIYFEMYKRTALGAETLLGTSHDTDQLTTSEAQHSTHAAITEDTAWVSGDRVVIKVYGRNSSASAKNATIHMEGDTASRVDIPGFIPPTFIPTHAHTHASTTGKTANDHHNESHALSSHSQSTNKIFYTKEAVFTELTLGAAGTVLVSGGSGADMAFSGDMATNSTHVAGDGSDHADVATNTTHRGLTNNPHTVTQAQVGLTNAVTAANVLTEGYIVDGDDGIRGLAVTSLTTAAVAALLDDSMQDSAHRHSEISAPDGAPSPSLSSSNIGVLSANFQSRAAGNRAGAQTGIAHSTYTTLIPTTQVYDQQAEYNPTTGIFTATEAGYYLVSWNALSQSLAWTAGEVWIVGLSKNNSTTGGSGFWNGFRWACQAAHTGYASSGGSAIVALSATDTLRMKVIQTSGGTIATYTNAGYFYLHIHKLS